MSNIIGSLPTFNQGGDDWNTYAEILDQFFIVNNVEDEKKSAFLISCVGTETYKTLRDLCHPTLPKDKPFDDLSEILRKQFSPQVAIFRERTKFYNAKQLPAENVTSWYSRMKRLSVDCKFADNLESILLDKFITGLRTGQVLDRLCEENETLTLQQAVDIASNKECSLMESNGGSR
jgi:Retrotransposon gag protein